MTDGYCNRSSGFGGLGRRVLSKEFVQLQGGVDRFLVGERASECCTVMLCSTVFRTGMVMNDGRIERSRRKKETKKKAPKRL